MESSVELSKHSRRIQLSLGGGWQPPDRDPVEGIDTEFKTGDIVQVKPSDDLRQIENRNAVVHGMFYMRDRKFIISRVNILGWYKTCYRLREIKDNCIELGEEAHWCFTWDMLIMVKEGECPKQYQNSLLVENLNLVREFNEELL